MVSQGDPEWLAGGGARLAVSVTPPPPRPHLAVYWQDEDEDAPKDGILRFIDDVCRLRAGQSDFSTLKPCSAFRVCGLSLKRCRPIGPLTPGSAENHFGSDYRAVSAPFPRQRPFKWDGRLQVEVQQQKTAGAWRASSLSGTETKRSEPMRCNKSPASCCCCCCCFS